jgi:hypothetical protein
LLDEASERRKQGLRAADTAKLARSDSPPAGWPVVTQKRRRNDSVLLVRDDPDRVYDDPWPPRVVG